VKDVPKSFADIPKDTMRGVVRAVEGAVGRVTLPAEYRRELGIATGDDVEIFLMTDGMYIRKKQPDNEKGA